RRPAAAARSAPSRYWRRPHRPGPGASQHALGTGQLGALAPHRHAQGAREGLEAGLDLVMVVVALDLEVEVERGGIAYRAEEVFDQFGWHLAHALAPEAAIEHEVGPAAEIERGAGQGLVHREGEAVARDAALVAQRLAQCLPQRDAGILDGVVLVDVQVAFGLH